MGSKKWRIGLLLGLAIFLFPMGWGKAQLSEDERLLVWTAPATTPNEAFQSQSYGEIAFADQNGELVTLNTITSPINRVIQCGQNAISPDGRYFAYFVGSDQTRGGSLYTIQGREEPFLVDSSAQLLSCVGANGRFMYSPDSALYAYIDYTATARTSEVATGPLFVRRVNESSNLVSFEGDITAFDFAADNSLIFLTLYEDNNNRKVEAVLSVWNGDTDREVMEFNATAGCAFDAGYVRAAGDDYWLLLFQDCPRDDIWALYRVSPDGSNALQVLAERPRGTVFTFTQTHNLWFSPEGERLIFSQSDGNFNYTTRISGLALDDFAVNDTVVDGSAIIASYNQLLYAPPVVSPDGLWLAIVTSTGQGENAINLISLTDGGVQVFPVEKRGDEIPFANFTSDSRRLIYISGGPEGRDNSIFAIEVGPESREQRLARGRFTRWATLSPQGDRLAVLEWRTPPQNQSNARESLNLMIVNLTDGSSSLLVSGSYTTTSNGLAYRFAAPLTWLSEE